MGGSNSKPSQKELERTVFLLQRAMEGDLNAIQQCIAEEKTDDLPALVDAAEPQQGNNALLGAVFGGHLPVVKYLVEECGASVTLKNQLGCSPIWVAAGYNRLDVLEYLLVQHPKGRFDCNGTGDSPLMAAASRNHSDVCRVLLDAAKAGADASGVPYLHLTNHSADTALTVALGNGQSDLALLLLSYLPDVPHAQNLSDNQLNRPNSKGVTPLLIACERQDNPTLVTTLLSKGASLELADPSGASPLAIAARCGHVETVKSILAVLKQDQFKEQCKHIVNQSNQRGETPLWMAAREGHSSTVRTLISCGECTLTQTDRDGLTPLEVAAKYAHEECIKVLKDATGVSAS